MRCSPPLLNAWVSDGFVQLAGCGSVTEYRKAIAAGERILEWVLECVGAKHVAVDASDMQTDGSAEQESFR